MDRPPQPTLPQPSVPPAIPPAPTVPYAVSPAEGPWQAPAPQTRQYGLVFALILAFGLIPLALCLYSVHGYLTTPPLPREEDPRGLVAFVRSLALFTAVVCGAFVLWHLLLAFGTWRRWEWAYTAARGWIYFSLLTTLLVLAGFVARFTGGFNVSTLVLFLPLVIVGVWLIRKVRL